MHLSLFHRLGLVPLAAFGYNPAQGFMKKSGLYLGLLLLNLAALLGQSARAQDQVEAQFGAAQEAVYRTLDQEDYLEKAAKTIDALPKMTDARRAAQIQFYKSLLKALKAEATFWPVRGLHLIKEALKEMDQSLAQDPSNYEFRMLRASTWYEVPGFLGKHEDGVKELKELASDFEKNSTGYPDLLKWHWLSFFLEHKLCPDSARCHELYLRFGGKEEDLG